MNHCKLDKAEQATWINGKQPKKLTRGDKAFMAIGLVLITAACVLPGTIEI